MNRLKELRLENNLTQNTIAVYLHIKQNTYSQYENEKRDMPTFILKKLAQHYKISIDYILALTNTPKSYPKSKVININSNMHRLKEIREDHDLLQKDLAKELQIERSTYSTYETGLCDIPLKILKKLALFYNIPMDYLLYMTDERTPYPRIKP